MKENKEIELRSEEVQDILTRVPHWMIRWGSIVIFILLMLLLLISWFVKYPEIVSSQIIITTAAPPQKLIAKTSGRIEVLLVKDKDLVKTNTPLAVIENTANYKDVFLLKSIVDTINLDSSIFPFQKLNALQLGDIESAYALFQKEYNADELNLKLQPYSVEENAQSYEATQLKERLNLLESQRDFNQNELELQKSDLDRYEGLHKKGIIATQELEKQKLLYLQAQKNYKSIISSISQIKSSLNELNKNRRTTLINEHKEDVNLERNVLQAFYQLKKAIKEWELNYVLRTSIDGKVSFLQLWAEHQTVNSGDPVFVVIPKQQDHIIGKAKAVALNSGKIKMGQSVNIRLANYPDREYGIVKGIVKAISLTPDKDGNLLIDVALPNGLQTSYQKKITFQQEMSGTADIITEDLRLMERLLFQLRN